MLPIAMPAAMASFASSTRPGAVDRLQDDPVELAGRDRVLELLRLGGRVEVAVEDRQLGVAGGGRRLGRGEHRRVVAVGDGERDVGELERLVVDRRGRAGRRLAGRGLAAALCGCAGRRRWWPAAGAATGRRERPRPPLTSTANRFGWHDPNRDLRACALLRRGAATMPGSVQRQ